MIPNVTSVILDRDDKLEDSTEAVVDSDGITRTNSGEKCRPFVGGMF